MVKDGAPPSNHASCCKCAELCSFVAVNGMPQNLPVIQYGAGRVGDNFMSESDAYAVFVLFMLSNVSVNWCDQRDGMRLGERTEEEGDEEEEVVVTVEGAGSGEGTSELEPVCAAAAAVAVAASAVLMSSLSFAIESLPNQDISTYPLCIPANIPLRLNFAFEN